MVTELWPVAVAAFLGSAASSVVPIALACFAWKRLRRMVPW